MEKFRMALSNKILQGLASNEQKYRNSGMRLKMGPLRHKFTITHHKASGHGTLPSSISHTATRMVSCRIHSL